MYMLLFPFFMIIVFNSTGNKTFDKAGTNNKFISKMKILPPFLLGYNAHIRKPQKIGLL